MSRLLGLGLGAAALRGIAVLAAGELWSRRTHWTMGGTLAFERLINPADGKRYVRTVLYYQTLQQMRSNAPLDLAHPPGKLVVKMPGCDKGEIDGACPLPIVRKRFEAAFAADCPGG